jgi:hypothetical protein
MRRTSARNVLVPPVGSAVGGDTIPPGGQVAE